MKRDNFLNYGHMFRAQEIEEKTVFPPEPDTPQVKEVISPQDAFLKLVYQLDPISKVPTGDLAFMASDKANPEVKQWVLQNLQMDTSSAQNLKAPEGLSDDDIIELTRQPNESVQSYAERVNVYLSNNKRLVESAVIKVQQDAASRAKSDVSSRSDETSVSVE